MKQISINDNTKVQIIRNGNLKFRGLWKDFDDKETWLEESINFIYDKDKNTYYECYNTLGGSQTWELQILEEYVNRTYKKIL